MRLILILLIALTGCAAWQDAPPHSKYLVALEWYNDNLEQYLESGVVNDKMDQVFIRGSLALDLWKAALEGNGDVLRQEEMWLEIQKQLFMMLRGKHEINTGKNFTPGDAHIQCYQVCLQGG